ncbi:hypothetical protein JTE90_007334 [Oedothorax gibbosus]|uniref:Chitin-binding type-2 domain-containing protein n=1 Tax=Oedothorax gibbosus TaxID=931172 RepID=A0AAV6URH7_9ARAC|nr:hypothetical protein JTE90_007334 [Oedothorax gibbosus]
MKQFCSFHSTLLLLLTGLQIVLENEALLETIIQRGGKSIFWRWGHQFPRTDAIRRRRFASAESSTTTTTWWKQMKDQAADSASNLEALVHGGEETYFTGTGHKHAAIPPFDEPEDSLTPRNETMGNSERERESPDPDQQHHSIDSNLLREFIIEERHRPSKFELASAAQRLREKPKASSSAEESPTTKSMEVSTVSKDVVPGQSFVEYIVPGVEHVVSHVEYVNKYDEEEFRIKPTVEYVLPHVEYVEPDVEYLSSTETSNTSPLYDDSDNDEREKEFPVDDEEYYPVDDYITIDQEHFWQVQDEEKFLPRVIDPSRRTGSRSKSKRIHRRNPEKGIPEVDYPTLEILPVVHFPCENYPTPGYYADIASRCQMFHVCNKNGMRTSFLCPVGTVFNQEFLVCDWWYNVECGSGPQDKPEPSIGPSDHNLEVATNDIRKKIDELMLGEKPDRHTSNQISQYPQSKEIPMQDDRTNDTEDETNSLNESQKSTNYPMGYGILLRELMKHSTQQQGPQQQDTGYSNSMDANGTQDFPEKEINLEERKSKIDWSSRRKFQDRNEQKRREYFGGSKPFAVSSGKKISKNVRIRKIRLKYVTPNLNDVTFMQNVTEAPFAKTYRYEYWPGRKLPRPEVLLSRQRTANDVQYARAANFNNKESNQFIQYRNAWTYESPPINNPIQRNDENARNITDDFEVIYPVHKKQNHISSKNRITLKNYNYIYSSAESNVENTEKQIKANNNSSDFEEMEESRNNSDIKYNPYIYLISRPLNYKKVHRVNRLTTKRPLQTTSRTKVPITKKAYILEPEPYPKYIKKFGDRLCYGKCPSTTKYEDVSTTTQLPMPDRTTMSTQKPNKRLSFSESKTTTPPTPVYLSPERFKLSEKGLESILGMKVNREAVTQLSPVYLGPETVNASKNLSQEIYATKHQIGAKTNMSGSPYASEFDYTSSFIKRISNLVSEIKSPGDTINWNHTQSINRIRKGKAYTISVRLEAKEVGNKTKPYPIIRNSSPSRPSTRHSKPWNIDFLDGPVSQRTYNASYNRKKHSSTLEIINEDNRNKNREKVGNSQGSFVLKKVRLKRYIPMQALSSDENKPAISAEKFIQYLRDRLVIFLRRILNVYS